MQRDARNSPQHTAGPWEYYSAGNYCGFAIAPLGTLPTLAAVERPRGNTNTLNITAFNFPGETEANARLIAAAPDLLAFAVALDADWTKEFPDGPDTKSALFRLSDDTVSLWRQARAAISRATGEVQS